MTQVEKVTKISGPPAIHIAKASPRKTRERDLYFRYFSIRVTPLNGVGVKSMFELLSSILQTPEVDQSLIAKLGNGEDSLLIYRLKQDTTQKAFIFHLFKVKGDPDELIADLENKVFVKLGDQIDIGDGKGILKHAVCAYDYENDILIWQRSKAVSLDDFKSYFQIIFIQNIEYSPVINSKTPEFFEAMDTKEWELEVFPSSPDGLVSLFDLPDYQKPSVLIEYLKEAGAGRATVTLKPDSNSNKVSLSKDFLKRETNFWTDFINRRRKVNVRARGIVKVNDRLEEVLIDLVKGTLLHSTKIKAGVSIDELWIEKEKSMQNALEHGRKFY